MERVQPDAGVPTDHFVPELMRTAANRVCQAIAIRFLLITRAYISVLMREYSAGGPRLTLGRIVFEFAIPF